MKRGGGENLPLFHIQVVEFNSKIPLMRKKKKKKMMIG